jgi:hypothetical protein
MVFSEEEVCGEIKGNLYGFLVEKKCLIFGEFFLIFFTHTFNKGG